MKKTTKLIALLALALPLTFSASSAYAGDGYGSHKKMKKADIVDTAIAADGFSTLVAAVKAAGLVDTLKGEGPFTVFAPTDAAFAALPEGTIESLLKPENKDKLISILTYHVVPAKVKSQDVKPMQAPTVNGTKATITVNDGKVMIDGANVIKTDIYASNGVIHVIDAVIMPAM